MSKFQYEESNPPCEYARVYDERTRTVIGETYPTNVELCRDTRTQELFVGLQQDTEDHENLVVIPLDKFLVIVASIAHLMQEELN